MKKMTKRIEKIEFVPYMPPEIRNGPPLSAAGTDRDECGPGSAAMSLDTVEAVLMTIKAVEATLGALMVAEEGDEECDRAFWDIVCNTEGVAGGGGGSDSSSMPNTATRSSCLVFLESYLRHAVRPFDDEKFSSLSNLEISLWKSTWLLIVHMYVNIRCTLLN